MTGATDHYSTLEVDRSASAAQLKSAYFRLIKEFTPENHPTRYFAITEAYRVLSNPAKRAEYDRRGVVPPEIVRLVGSALEAEDEGEYSRAVAIMEQVTQRAPDYEDGWFVLGRVLDASERTDEAIGAFTAALERNPKSSRNLIWLGDAYRKKGHLEAARRYLREALVLDPKNSDGYYCLASTYLDADQDEEALRVVDRGIAADGKVDVQDLPLFMRKFVILSRLNRWSDMTVALRSLDSAVPHDDREARKYCADRFIDFLDSARAAARLDIAAFAVDALEVFAPSYVLANPSLSLVRTTGRAQASRRTMYADSQVSDLMKALVQVWSKDYVPEKEIEFLEGAAYMVASSPKVRFAEWETAVRLHPNAVEPFRAEWSVLCSLGWKVLARRIDLNPKPKTGCLIYLVTGGALLGLMSKALSAVLGGQS